MIAPLGLSICLWFTISLAAVIPSIPSVQLHGLTRRGAASFDDDCPKRTFSINGEKKGKTKNLEPVCLRCASTSWTSLIFLFVEIIHVSFQNRKMLLSAPFQLSLRINAPHYGTCRDTSARECSGWAEETGSRRDPWLLQG